MHWSSKVLQMRENSRSRCRLATHRRPWAYEATKCARSPISAPPSRFEGHPAIAPLGEGLATSVTSPTKREGIQVLPAEAVLGQRRDIATSAEAEIGDGCAGVWIGDRYNDERARGIFGGRRSGGRSDAVAARSAG